MQFQRPLNWSTAIDVDADDDSHDEGDDSAGDDNDYMMIMMIMMMNTIIMIITMENWNCICGRVYDNYDDCDNVDYYDCDGNNENDVVDKNGYGSDDCDDNYSTTILLSLLSLFIIN